MSIAKLIASNKSLILRQTSSRFFTLKTETKIWVSSDDPIDSRQAAILAQVVNQMVNLKYNREDELESDRLGLRFMAEAGYNANGIVELSKILNAASGNEGQPEFLSTHPNPVNRLERLIALIDENYPQGIPDTLKEGRQSFTRVVSPRL